MNDSIFKNRIITKSTTQNTVRKSLNTPPGVYDDDTHYLIDCKTSEALQLAFIKWCETGDKTTFDYDLQQLKEIYGEDYKKTIPFTED